MIIESLHNYYLSESAKDNPLYPKQGMELKRIHFVIVISKDGVLIDIEEIEGMMNVIRSRQRAGKDSCKIPNYMWDSLSYVVGFDGATIHHASFKEMVREATESYPDNRTFKAVRNFYYHGVEQLYNHSLWGRVSSKKGHNITFRLVGESKTAAEQTELLKPLSKSIALSHPKIYINGASGTGAKLVSYGKNQGYESYGLSAGENASISVEVAEGYTSAITALRQMNGEGNRVIGDVTFLFFGREVIAFVPNVARVSVRLHNQDCDTTKLTDKELISQLMVLAPYGDTKRLSPQFIVDFVESFVTDKPLPKQTLNLLLKYRGFHPTHIELLRKYLNINDMALNTDYTNTGYLLGRMLAIVERAQIASQPGLNYTIKDQTYATMSVTPAALFNRVISLSTNYFRRIPRQGTQVYLKNLLSEVADKISVDGVPMRLSLEDQGRFALGYQHQNQSFYTKKETEDERDS
ncbi:MAG: type I-C CRISPR-associated protein Cas8c/Csd1 [Rikenellaceae bacterium]